MADQSVTDPWDEYEMMLMASTSYGCDAADVYRFELKKIISGVVFCIPVKPLSRLGKYYEFTEFSQPAQFEDNTVQC